MTLNKAIKGIKKAIDNLNELITESAQDMQDANKRIVRAETDYENASETMDRAKRIIAKLEGIIE